MHRYRRQKRFGIESVHRRLYRRMRSPCRLLHYHRKTRLTYSPDLSTQARPADFRARRQRDVAGIGRTANARRALRLRGRQLLALVAAIAVPAMAAPVEWQGFAPNADRDVQLAAARPMPFEKRGHSFPGSAFYYLEDTPELLVNLPTLNPDVDVNAGRGDNAVVPLVQTHPAGAAANAFAARGTGLDRARASLCLSQAIWYEAATESTAGQRAVAQVVLNRVAHRSYPGSVCGVVYQGSERSTGCQFSFTCDGSLRRKAGGISWANAQRLASEALSGAVFGQVGMATHYHTNYVSPYWAPTLDHIGTIGAHRFYRMKGNAGQRSAFSSSYRGGEPFAAPKPRLPDNDLSPIIGDPLELTRTYETARLKAQGAGRAAPVTPAMATPTYSAAVEARGGDALFKAGKLPQSGAVKPEYANSGQWIAQPK